MNYKNTAFYSMAVAVFFFICFAIAAPALVLMDTERTVMVKFVAVSLPLMMVPIVISLVAACLNLMEAFKR